MSYVTFYRNDPNAPRTTMPTHLGANAIITWEGKLLLEKRRDSDSWGLPGGGVKKTETGRDAIAREIYEELGLRIPEDISAVGYDGIHLARVMRLTTYSQNTQELGRIAAEKLISLIERPKTTLIDRILVPGGLLEGSSVKDIR